MDFCHEGSGHGFTVNWKAGLMNKIFEALVVLFNNPLAVFFLGENS